MKIFDIPIKLAEENLNRDLSVTKIEDFAKYISFPVTNSEIVNRAIIAGTHDSLLKFLYVLPSGRYSDSSQIVMAALSFLEV